MPLEDVAQSERRLVLLENVHRPRLKACLDLFSMDFLKDFEAFARLFLGF